VNILGAAEGGAAAVFIELGAVALGLALLARLSSRWGITAIPFYLLAGLAVGEGGVAPLDVTHEFIALGAEIGALLLLLALGLEYAGSELRAGLREGAVPGLADGIANFSPGLLAGWLLGWDTKTAILLGGVCWVSSSGVTAKVLTDLGRLGNRETPSVLNLLVIEDLAMAAYLPAVAALLSGGSAAATAGAVALAVTTVAAILVAALRWGHVLSGSLARGSDEALLLSVVGLTLFVGGLAQRLQVSAAIAAFLVGLALSGPAQHRAGALIGPLRDLFAATFFLFFSFQIRPSSLLDVAVPAALLVVVTAATKIGAGWVAAARTGVGVPGRLRAGTALVARGEFSIVIASLGAVTPEGERLGALAAAYVLLTAVAGPLLAKHSQVLLPAVGRLRAAPIPSAGAGKAAGPQEARPVGRITEAEAAPEPDQGGGPGQLLEDDHGHRVVQRGQRPVEAAAEEGPPEG
jgi:CPA2 family monovalent cation:H+ antiporter-2